MLIITDLAAEKGKQILAVEGKSGWGLRIYIAGSSCCGPAFGMDMNEQPTQNDEVIEKNGLKVFMDKSILSKLDGMELHFVDKGEQQGFVLNNKTGPSSCRDSSCSTC